MENELAEKKWQDFLGWISQRSNGFVFRGVSNKEYLLIPSVGRLDNYTFQNEINLFEQFKMRAKMHTSASNDFEWLSIAQHHSLPTRLLDWTENPLIACFFAVTSNKEKDGRVYFTKMDGLRIVDVNSLDPFAESQIHFYFPNIITSRISLQKGLFTIHPKPNVPVVIVPPTRNNSYVLVEINNVYDYIEDLNSNIRYYIQPKDEKESDFEYQEKFYNLYSEIPLVFNIEAQYKDYFENKIRQLGIDETIFGDIDSIAQKLKNDLKREHLHPIFHREDVQEYINETTQTLQRHPIYYFKKYIENKKYCVMRSNIIISHYEKIAGNLYSFQGAVEIHPNYFDIDQKAWTITPEQSIKIKKFYIILSKVIDHLAYTLPHLQDSFLFYFKIEEEFKNGFSHICLKSELYPKNGLVVITEWYTIELYYNLFKKYEEIINNNEEDKQVIEKFDFTSIEFDKFISESSFLAKFQSLLDMYKQLNNNNNGKSIT